MTPDRAPFRRPDAAQPIRPMRRGRLPGLNGVAMLLVLGLGALQLAGALGLTMGVGTGADLTVDCLAALTAPGLVLVLVAARRRQRARVDRGAGRPRVEVPQRLRPVRGPAGPGRRLTR